LQIISWVSVVLMLIRLEQDALSAAPVNRRTVIRIASTMSALSLLLVFRLLSRLIDLVEREVKRIARSRAEDVVRTKELATLVAQLAGRQ
jgi:hypothetical protein